MSRKTKSIYGDLIKSSLMKEQPWLQAEKLPSYLPYFVGDLLLEQINNNSNQLIVGRRGTGKSHYFGAFKEWIIENEQNNLVIFLSCLDFSGTPDKYVNESPAFISAKYSRLLFKNFLRIFIDLLILQIDQYFILLSSSLSNEALNKIKLVTDDKLLKLLQLIEHGNNHDYSEIDHSQELEINVSRIRRSIIELLEFLKIKTLFVLIDEWAEIDKNLDYQIQPYFAQLLKILLFNTNKIAVKIASVWKNTNLYDRDIMQKSKGIQLGEDIQLGADLDVIFMDNEKSIMDFFKKMLFKRLGNLVPKLNEIKDFSNYEDFFISELFDNESNFKALVAASHGIPRDFLEIFYQCSLKISHDFKNDCIHKGIIRTVSKDIYLVELRKRLEKNSDAHKLWELINDYMERTSQRFFIIINDEEKRSHLVKKLVDEEFIHPIPSSLIPRIIRDKYKMYQINYGNFIDWFRNNKTINPDILEESILPLVPENFKDIFENYIITLNSLNTTFIYCHHCKKSFPKEHPVFQRFSSCPICADEIDLNVK